MSVGPGTATVDIGSGWLHYFRISIDDILDTMSLSHEPRDTTTERLPLTLCVFSVLGVTDAEVKPEFPSFWPLSQRL